MWSTVQGAKIYQTLVDKTFMANKYVDVFENLCFHVVCICHLPMQQDIYLLFVIYPSCIISIVVNEVFVCICQRLCEYIMETCHTSDLRTKSRCLYRQEKVCNTSIYKLISSLYHYDIPVLLSTYRAYVQDLFIVCKNLHRK